ncbi:formate dehydrogenase family accessory protein FdhD [Rhizobium sp. Root1203]|uniref:formate dehydrogenase accessory sulfurtransferase FdhD n=1 Tax=Rhizobium sp. Root1203 TaxID=1736427 RepID=UPI00070D18FF|nr:formate dehydrogenase accessory sulfurtransferase FdhD [Rhizobium sp. Root1203]KQV24351.1 formate dehydrogenase family accessory protein FdhD [Rhizobium sp. Root1203]
MTQRPTRIAVRRIARSGGVVRSGERIVPEEIPIAFSYGGTTHAVMMGTPGDLEDFAVGFTLTEGIVATREEIASIDIVEGDQGIDVQVSLVEDVAAALSARRRSMAGPVGCGLCGIESIEQAVRKVSDVSVVAMTISHRDVVEAVSLLNGAQPLHRETRAVHGAAFYIPGKGLAAVREDVGRHNALDKLCGAVVGLGLEGGSGVVAVTSRLSVEMVQKAAILGSPVLIAISAPTALAIRTAEEAGMTLIALVRGEDFEIFTHPHRIQPGSISDVA